MSEAVIVEAVRTAIGRRNGKLSPVRPDDLLALTLKEVVNRAGVDPAVVDDVIVGCVTQTGEQGLNIGRASVLIAGFPIERCAVVMLEEIRDHLRGATPLEHVEMVLFDERGLSAFQDALAKMDD